MKNGAPFLKSLAEISYPPKDRTKFCAAAQNRIGEADFRHNGGYRELSVVKALSPSLFLLFLLISKIHSPLKSGDSRRSRLKQRAGLGGRLSV